MNDVKLIGRLTRDPDAPTEYGGGFRRLNFGLAVQRDKRQGADGPDVDFFNVTAWNKQADNIHRYLRKGARIALSGHLRAGSYQDKDGRQRNALDIIADRVWFLESRNENPSPAAPQDAPMVVTEELPF